jgi:hypothetical protein
VTGIDSRNLTIVEPNITVGTNPDAVAVDPTTETVYVANFGSNNVSRFNASTGLPVGPGVPVGGQPEAELFDPVNGEIYVANSGTNNLTVLNASTGAAAGPAIPAGSGPVALTLDAAHNLLFVADASGGTITVINGSTNTAQGTPISVGPDPQGVAYDPVHNALYVSDYASGAILVLAATPTIVSFTATPMTSEPGVPLNLTAVVAATPYQLNYSYRGLPPGCGSIDAPQLVCIPSSPGTYSITVTVGLNVPGFPATRTTELTLLANPSVASVAATPAVFALGTATTLVASVSAGVGPFHYAWMGLPPGCGATSSSNLTCHPTQSGRFVIAVVATDALEVSALGWTNVSVVPVLSISGFAASASRVVLGANLTLAVGIAGGLSPLAFSYSGLPVGCLSQNSSVLTCQPTGVGNFSPTVRVVDALGQVGFASLSLQVVAMVVAPLRIVGFEAVPDNLSLGQTVSFLLDLSGPATNATLTYSGLPTGCRPENVTPLRCSPTGVGSFSVTVTAVARAGGTATAVTNLTVLPSPAGPVQPSSGPSAALLAGAAGLVALLAGGIGGFILGRRRQKPDLPS